MIALFHEVVRNKLNICGGKGKSLIKMTVEGFPVPRGFIIGSDEFMEYIKINGLLDLPLNEMWQSIINGSFPRGMSDRIFDLYTKVFPNNEKVAVRSSALCEDGVKFAWSGELETFLFVDKNSLIESVKKCFASLFSERALIYAKRANVNRAEFQMAVIVQHQIESEFAGVAFSNNPVSGENEILIELVTGQGESLVSGEVIPDKYVFSYDGLLQDNTVRQSNIHIANWHLERIVENVKLLKELYDFPVDVEWAVEKENLFILQCRPITTITNAGKISTLLTKLFPPSKWNFDTQGAFHYMIMHTVMSAADKRLHEKVFGFHRQIEDCLRLNGQVFKLKNAKEFLNTSMSENVANDSEFLIRFAKLWNDVVEWEKSYVAHLLSTKWKEVSNDELINETKSFSEKYKCSLVYVYYYIDDYLEESFVSLLKKEYSFSDELCDEIFNNIATCSNDFGPLFYSEEPIDLLKIAIKKQNGENISELVDDHVAKYGWMLAPLEREFKVFENYHYEQRINSWISDRDVSDRLNRIFLSREENDIRFRDTAEKYHFTKELLDLANSIRTFIYYRTFLTEHTDWLFFYGRTTILREIARREAIFEDDLVMLSLDEVISFLEKSSSKDTVQSLAQSRTQNYAIVYISDELLAFDGDDALYIERGFVPFFIDNLKKSSLGATGLEEVADAFVKGTVCYPGRIIGEVKIVKSLADCDKVQKGDILVANMTTPNFISAMERAAGFVTDQGGITCHAAILSREMCIPCIVGTSIATKVLHDGNRVELDAYSGIVRVLK